MLFMARGEFTALNRGPSSYMEDVFVVIFHLAILDSIYFEAATLSHSESGLRVISTPRAVERSNLCTSVITDEAAESTRRESHDFSSNIIDGY